VSKTSKTYRPYAPGQSFLLPPSPLDWLPEDHLARFILDVVQMLDLKAITGSYEKEHRGFPPHHPVMMTALLLYAYCVGVPSSRKIAKRTYEDVAFRVIAGNTHPDYSCISEFRRIHLAALSGLFVQVLAMCEVMGLAQLGMVALDGTKVKANASKHKAMSYERMQADEERLAAKVAQLLKQAEQVDQGEDEQYGAGRRGDELPEDLRRAQSRLARIREAKAQLEAEVKQQAQTREANKSEEQQVSLALTEMNNILVSRQGTEERAMPAPIPTETEPTVAAQQDTPELPSAPAPMETGPSQAAQQDGPKPSQPGLGPTQMTEHASVQRASQEVPPQEATARLPTPEPLPLHQHPTQTGGQPAPKAQRNFTDPESRILKSGSDYIQGYNAQIAVDREFQIIVAQGLSNQSPDAEYFIPMLDRIVENCGRVPQRALGDAGYFSESNVRRSACRGVDAYLAPGRTGHGQKAQESLSEAEAAQASAKARMKAKLSTPEGAGHYSRRKVIVEPVFGQIKNRGFRQFLLRGLEKVRGEWSLITLSHNLLKLHSARRMRRKAA
jgi:transposase